MSSVPNSYIDDLRSIVLATLNRIEQLRMRVLFGVQFVKGAYGQELQFKSDGKVYIDGIEIGGVTWNTQSFTNLLDNGDFGSWSAGASAAPDGWTKIGVGSTIARDNANELIGDYCAALTRVDNLCYLNHAVDDFTRYSNRTLTYGCWVKDSTADNSRISFYDGVDYKISSYHTGGGGWELLTVSGTMNASPTGLSAQVFNRNVNSTVYFDGAILVEGSVCPAFSPKPLVDDGQSIQINSNTNVVTIDGTLKASTAEDLTLTVDTGQAFVFSKV